MPKLSALLNSFITPLILTTFLLITIGCENSVTPQQVKVVDTLYISEGTAVDGKPSGGWIDIYVGREIVNYNTGGNFQEIELNQNSEYEYYPGTYTIDNDTIIYKYTNNSELETRIFKFSEALDTLFSYEKDGTYLGASVPFTGDSLIAFTYIWE